MKNKQKKLEYDWFGITKKKSKRIKPVTVSYLGLKNPKSKYKSTVSFLGRPQNIKMTPSSIFRKERINQRYFSRWGDVDMDGSPNYFDCDPTNFLKDTKPIKGRIKNVFKMLKEEVKGTIKREAEALKDISPTRRERRATKERGEAIQRVEERVEKRKEKIETIKLDIEAKKAGKVKDPLTGEIILPSKEEIKQVAAEEKLLEKASESALKRKKAETGYEKFLEAAKITGPARDVKMKELAIEETIAAGKRPSQKQIMAYQKALGKTSVGARAKRMAQALGVGGVAGVIGGYGLTKTKEGSVVYGKEMRARSARVRKLTESAAGLLISPSLTAKSFSSEPRGRGRPAGPSGEYKIGGKPVYEEEYRQWQAKQNALNRMLPSEAQSQTLTPEYLEYIKSQQMQQQMQAQQSQQEVLQETMGSEEGMNEPVPSDQAPKTEGITNEEVQAIEEARRRPYTRSSQEEIRQAQQAAQQKDQILNAPNFMKGELKAAGGGILTPTGPQIMDAPNVFKGEMRNVYSDGDVPAVRLSERPQTNPYGDEYLEIELGSGKPVVRRRIREKWMDGSAL
jgi:hypothetical protein